MPHRERPSASFPSASSVTARSTTMRSNLYGNAQRPSADTAETKAARGTTLEMEEQLQRENEAMLSALGNSVATMKGMASNLHRSAEEQNQLLKGISDAFTTARSGVGSATAGLQGVMSRYGWKHTAMFGCTAFLVLYLIIWAVTRK